VALLNGLSRAQSIGVAFAAIFYVVAGMLHFHQTRHLPEDHAALYPVEILGGLGLLVPQTRRAAAWGLVALLIAVFPANVYMATNPIDAGAASIAPILRWGRLPSQLLLVWWLLWCTSWKKPRR